MSDEIQILSQTSPDNIQTNNNSSNSSSNSSTLRSDSMSNSFIRTSSTSSVFDKFFNDSQNQNESQYDESNAAALLQRGHSSVFGISAMNSQEDQTSLIWSSQSQERPKDLMMRVESMGNIASFPRFDSYTASYPKRSPSINSMIQPSSSLVNLIPFTSSFPSFSQSRTDSLPALPSGLAADK